MDQKLTLFELNQVIKDAIQNTVPGTVWVMAEISELKENRNGHCYLELVEKKENEIIARVRATVWSYTYRILKPYFETITGQVFTHGLKVLLQGTVEFHPAFGLSLNIKDIDPVYTIGDMALQRKAIIERLLGEGIFDMNKELALPLVPQNIAVISSKTAAGYQDFTDQLKNNPGGIKFYVKLFEASMQGTGAVSSIISALERIFQHENHFDAVAIIRGGGATADLSCFDNYELAFNVTQFPLPVVTGIGHEKDDTVIDLVAHTRMKTPTAVAEFFIGGAEIFYERLKHVEEMIVRQTKGSIELKQEQLEDLTEHIRQLVDQVISEKKYHLLKQGARFQKETSRFSFSKKIELNSVKHDLRSAVRVWNAKIKIKLDRPGSMMKKAVYDFRIMELAGMEQLNNRVKNKLNRLLDREKERINLNEQLVRLLNPNNVLKRGYTLTLKDGAIVKSTNQLDKGDTIETRFYDGKTESKITKTE